jgi:hypothetical protein
MSAPTRADFGAAAERCLDFLAAQFDDRGAHRAAPDDPAQHYKLIYVFAYADRRALALRVLEHMERVHLADDGGYRDPSLNGPGSAFLYQSGWLAWGAAALGRFDVARRVARQAMSQQDEGWGGFWNDTELGRVQWLLNSSSAGAGCAAAGELEAARHSARHLERLLTRQPAPDEGFYFSLGEDGQVVAGLGDEPTRNHFDLTAWARPAMFATAIAGLAWLTRQSLDDRFADLARRYCAVILSHRGQPERMQFASKSGWAMMQVHALRPDPALAAYAEGVGRRLLELQADDGSVDLSGWPGLEGGAPPALTLASTCDWTLTAVALANGAA